MAYINKVKWLQILLCITNNSIKHQSFVYSQLNDQIFLFLIFQFCMSFVCTQLKCQTILFDSWIESFQVLLFRAKVNLGVMAMKRYSTFPKAQALLELHWRLFCVISRTIIGESYPFAKIQLVYSTTPADWAYFCWVYHCLLGLKKFKASSLQSEQQLQSQKKVSVGYKTISSKGLAAIMFKFCKIQLNIWTMRLLT